MSETVEEKSIEIKVDAPVIPAVQVVSDILKPTLQDNDFLQSFVRIGIDDGSDSRQTSSARREGRKDSLLGPKPQKLTFQEPVDGRRASRVRSSLGRPGKSVRDTLQEEVKLQKSRKRRRRRSDAHRQEEVYTDKDRAAAVNMGSRDIKQSLRLKRKQDRSKALQIPEEAEPGSMLALGTRELTRGNLNVALSCIDKALELSPKDKNALIARSRCHLLLGDSQKALDDAEAALRGRAKKPHSARALFAKAEALYHLGDFELSLVFYYRGMKIRPEFDQFRLGVQKAKEAIQNILGGASVPIPQGLTSHNDNHSQLPDENSSARPKTCSPATFLGLSEKSSENTSRTVKSTIQHSEPRVGPSKTNSTLTIQRRRPRTAKRPTGQELHLLRQLNVDKRYLQNLVKRPDIRAAHQESAKHIIVYAEEGINFLKSREEFWRQQRMNKK